MATETRVVKLTLDASQMNKALAATANNTAKLSREVQKSNTHLKTMEKDMKKGAKAAQDFNRSIVVFRRAMTALFAIRIAEGFISELQAVDNQLKIATNSTEEYVFMQEQLLRVANDTRQSFEGTVKLYARIVRANDELGLSSREIVNVTENINKALAAQGASAQESRSVLLQLSQAFGSGRLAGEEFRAVAEGAPLILKDLAASLEVNVGQLKAMAAAGELTAEVLATALQEATNTEEEFVKANATLGQALQVLADQFSDFVRDLNDSTGGFSALAQAVLVLADNIAFLTGAIIALLAVGLTKWIAGLAVALWTKAIPPLIAFTSNMTLSAIATGGLSVAAAQATRALVLLRAALVLTGIGAIIVGVGLLANKLSELSQATGGFSNAITVVLLDLQVRFYDLSIAVFESLNWGGIFDNNIANTKAWAAESRKEIDKIIDGQLEKNVAQILAFNKKGAKTPGVDSGAADEAKRLESFAQSIIKDLRSASEIYAEAEADIQASLAAGFLDEAAAQVFLTNLRNELDPTKKALDAFNKSMLENAATAVKLNLGMSMQEIAFKNSALAAGKTADELDALWIIEKRNLDSIEASLAAEEKRAQATADSQTAMDDWAKVMEDTLTAQELFNKQLDETRALADLAGASEAELSKKIAQLTKDYYDASVAGRALFKVQEDQINLANQLRSQFDNRQIIADSDAQKNKVEDALNVGLISREVYNKEIIRLDNEKNLRLIENGTKTMQILASASDEFVTGFGDAMLDFAQGSEDAFSDFAKSFAASMADMIVQTLILIPLMEALNALIAGLGSGGGVNISTGGGGGLPPSNTSSGFSSLSTASASVASAGAAAANTVVRATNTAVTGSSSSSSRSSGGGSGETQVNVIVNNSSPAQVDVRQSQTSDGTELEILVTNAVRQGFQNGQMDETMSATYGIQRRGY